jgi:DNA (cytosine-5)-methyltransferase 1
VGSEVAYTHGTGLEGARWTGLPRGEDRQSAWPSADKSGSLHNANGGRYGSEGRSVFAGRPSPELSSWWTTEPDVGRVAHGVPSRVDRLRGLGNAVVPQVAEWIGRRLMEVSEQRREA